MVKRLTLAIYVISTLPLEALKFVMKTLEAKGFFQFEIIITVLISSF